MSSLNKEQKEMLLDYLLSHSMNIITAKDGGEITHIVQSASPAPKPSRGRSRTFGRVSEPSQKISQGRSPRTGLHRAVSIGIVTYKGGLSPVSYTRSKRSGSKPSRSAQTSKQHRNLRSMTSSPTLTTPMPRKGELSEKTRSAGKMILKEEEKYPTFFGQFQVPRGSRPKRLSRRRTICEQ